MHYNRLWQGFFHWLFIFISLLFIPYIQGLTVITDCIGLQAIQNNLAGSYQLANDIDCSATANWNSGAGFAPLGNSSTSFFSGTFDGQGHKVLGLTINRPLPFYVGLFGYLQSPAQVYSVGIVGGFILGSSYAGGLVGYNNGATITNAYATGFVSGGTGGTWVGGLVGYNNGATITNAYTIGFVSGGSTVGGLVGENYNSAIINAYATGNVSGLAVGSGYGGLVGWNNRGGTISSAYAAGNVSGLAAGGGYGGLVGENSNGATITNSYATGNIFGAGGGLVSWNSASISSAYATGNIFGGGGSGGLVGTTFTGSTITNAYATGNVFGGGGGLVSSNAGTITNAYATGKVLGGVGGAGGLINSNSGGTVVSSYWDIQTSTQATSAAGVGLTTQTMQQTSSFLGWDFALVWVIYAKYTYPLLRVFITPPILSNPLSNVTQYIGVPLELTIPANVFTDPNGLQLTYSAALPNGSPLPPWLAFTPSTQTFAGTPLSGAQGLLMIEVSVYNLPTQSISDIFQLTIPDRPPMIKAPFISQVALNGQPFQFIIPSVTFFDPDGDPLQLTATLTNGTSLPAWLSFNEVLGIFSGTSPHRGNEWINVTANDGFGGQISALLEIVTPNTAPTTTGIFPNQVVIIAQSFSFTIPTNLFFDLDGDALTYAATLFGGGQLLPWLNFNAQTLMFQGTPDTAGFLLVSVIATDPYNATTSLNFGISVSTSSGIAPPQLAIQMLDQAETVNQPFTLVLPQDMFIDSNGSPLTYSAMLEGGTPLPSWLNFNASSLVFSGVASTTGNLHITVRADNGGGFALDTFTLTILNNQNLPPFLQNAISNQVVSVGENYQFIIASNTFIDLNNGPLTYSAATSGNSSLPHWLHFNANTRTFSGTPSNTDTNLYAPRITMIEVHASNGFGSSVTTFQLSVTGTSEGAQIINALITLASVASTAFAVYRNRAFLWNTFLKKKYEKDAKQISLNEPFTYQFTVPSEKILYVKTFNKAPMFTHKKWGGCLKWIHLNSYEKLLDGNNLPEWLDFNRKTMTLSGIPAESGDLYICAEGFDGRYLEAFQLRCGKPNGKDVEMQNI